MRDRSVSGVSANGGKLAADAHLPLGQRIIDRMKDLPIDHQTLGVIVRALGFDPPDNCPMDRVLTTKEANFFLRKKKGFLEKRRCSGIDSPRYAQVRKGGAVLYRTSDLLAWEEQHMRTCTSE